jgi:hypothetical protein
MSLTKQTIDPALRELFITAQAEVIPPLPSLKDE